MAVNGDAASLAASRSDYSGAAGLEIQQHPEGDIDLNATTRRRPIFAVHRTGQNSIFSAPGIKFRWVVRDSTDNRYLLTGLNGESVFEFGDESAVRIGLPTRALLRERGIRNAEVLCRVRTPLVGERLLTLPVTLTS
jgi:hypothetical protein